MSAESADSVLVSRTMDDLGYNQQMVRFRQQYWRKVGQQSELFYSIVAGSKGEGLTKFLESDVDYVHVVKTIVCTSRNPISYNNVENLAVLQMDRTNTAQGYTRLICVQIGTYIYPFLYASLTEPIAGNMYLSSDSWRDQFRWFSATKLAGHLRPLRQGHAQGPSTPISVPAYGFNTDNVLAVICDCPEILQSWIHRPRRHGWPPAEVIEEISTLEAHVVPVGFKGSPCQFLEWRICFTRAEIKLIQSLNDCQIKLIILFKTIAKSSLKPVCKEMTTYVMKNVVLWMAELYPSEIFTEQNLLSSLQRALRFLRQCLEGRFLPSYMIPERNLLANGLGLSERTRLCTTIDTLLHEGPHVILRCDKIKSAWNMFYTVPETFRFFIKTCRQAEIIQMLNDDPDAKEKCVRLTIALIDTILPECIELAFRRPAGVNDLFIDRIRLFLS